MDKLYGDLKVNEVRNIKKNEKKTEEKKFKKEAQENFESIKWNEQWEKAKTMKEKSEAHEVFLSKVQDNRLIKQVEIVEEKKEQEKLRSEAINSELRFQYQNLIKEKEATQKTISLYKLIRADRFA